MPEERDERSFEQRVLRELPSVRAYLRRVAGPEGEPEDLLQEVAARALKYSSAFDPARELGPWLRAMALRLVIDQRERTRRAPGELRHTPEAQERGLELVEHREDLQQRLSRLTAVERDVLVRFHGRGESVRAISIALAMPEGTVKSHLHRARKRLGAVEAP